MTLRVEVSGGVSDHDSFGRVQPTTADDADRIVTLTFASATGGTVTVSIHASDPSGSRAGSFEKLQQVFSEVATMIRMYGSLWDRGASAMKGIVPDYSNP